MWAQARQYLTDWKSLLYKKKGMRKISMPAWVKEISEIFIGFKEVECEQESPIKLLNLPFEWLGGWIVCFAAHQAWDRFLGRSGYRLSKSTTGPTAYRSQSRTWQAESNLLLLWEDLSLPGTGSMRTFGRWFLDPLSDLNEERQWILG